MYIGGVGSAGLHHLVWEILDNAVDEAMNGYASNIAVALHKDGASMTIQDDGRGIPVDKHPTTKTSALEVIFTKLHAGGKFEGQNYKTAGGLHGVGASVVNALSRELVATVRRDGATWEQKYKQGEPQSAASRSSARRAARARPCSSGPTRRSFRRPNSTPRIIRERLEVASYLHKGLQDHVRERGGRPATSRSAKRFSTTRASATTSRRFSTRAATPSRCTSRRSR